MNLSDHFTLEELTHSDEAVRLAINNSPDDQQQDALRRLCVEILEPLRAALGKPIRITSGLRVPVLNVIVGGSPSSDHCYGRAADIKVDGMSAGAICGAIRSLGLPYKQLIQEFGAWCHVSIPPAGTPPVREELTARKVAGRTEYHRGIA